MVYNIFTINKWRKDHFKERKMFKYVKTGFGPFKKMKLCETFNRIEKPRVIKDVEEILPKGVTLTYTGDGQMQITTPKGCTDVNVYAFDVINDCITYLDYEGQWGFITKQGKIVPTNTHENSTMSTLDVIDNVVVAKVIHNRSRVKAYVPFDATTGEPIVDEIFKSYHCGDKTKGVKGQVIFFEQYGGNKTLVSRGGTLLTTDCIRYEGMRDNIIALSLDQDDKKTTWLEAFNLDDTDKPKLTLVQRGVRNFDFGFDELITYTDKKSSVYEVNFNNPDGKVFDHKFDATGEVKKLSYTFYGNSIYITKTKDGAKLLDNKGNAVTTPDLKGLVDAKYSNEHSITTTVEKNGVQKQGMIRSFDYATIIPPVYDRVTDVGCNLVVNTLGDTFEMAKLIPTKDNAYGVETYTTTPKVVVEMNNYFRPQKTDKNGTIICEDSNEETIIIAPNKAGVAVMPIDKYDEYLDNRRNAPLTEILGGAQAEQEQAK